MARPTQRERVRQVANWLNANHPTPHPVELKIVSPRTLSKELRQTYGWAERLARGGRITLVEHHNASIGSLTDTLLHEWAHLLSFGPYRWETQSGFSPEGRSKPRADFPHDATWGCAYAALIESFHDATPPGSLESKKYPRRYFIRRP